ncbi:hypothetical protein [Desulfopila sp. IMCC35008]|uniref:hypothetical protein n=1 Tax=Desulfopila sp. IMCC35008 TaxID=2653858 RepID=UPI0013D293A6|nr:hypothetical protein [Desulfopila sp. IMCC35008]
MKKLVALIFFCTYLIGIAYAEAGDVFHLGYSEYRPSSGMKTGNQKESMYTCSGSYLNIAWGAG